MNAPAQIIYMQSYTKKILIPILIISLFIICLFFTQNYLENQLASLSGIITAWVTVNPLEAEVSAPAEVEINEVFKVEAKAINKGKEKIENAEAEIRLPSGLILLRKDSVQKIGVILGKREKKVSWSVKGEATGNYVVSVKVSAELKGQIISAEDSSLVEVKESLPKGRGWLQNFFDFFQERFGF